MCKNVQTIGKRIFIMTQFHAVVVITVVEYARSHEYYLPIFVTFARILDRLKWFLCTIPMDYYIIYETQYRKVINMGKCIQSVKKSAIIDDKLCIMYSEEQRGFIHGGALQKLYNGPDGIFYPCGTVR